MTREEAAAIYDSEEWKQWTDLEKVRKQLYESRLMMPFPEFKAALSRVLGRHILTHEYGDASALRAELEARPT